MIKTTTREKIAIGLAYLMQLFIVALIVIAFVRKDILNVFGGLASLFVTFLPQMLKRKWNVTLPWSITFLIVLSLYLHMLGQVAKFYEIFAPFYDKVGHFIGSVTVALLGFALVIIVDKFTKIKLTKNSMIFFTIIFTVAVGAFWEIGEFIIDNIFGIHTQAGLTDTMLDLIFDFLGAVLIAFVGNIRYQTIRIDLIKRNLHLSKKSASK